MTTGISGLTTEDLIEHDHPYVIVRTQSAGVFAGTLETRDGKEAVLTGARRLWEWWGASLSQVAETGPNPPGKCRFPVEVSRVLLTEVIEILWVTEQAKAVIAAVPVWSVS